MKLNYISTMFGTGITIPTPGQLMIEIFIPVLFICVGNNCEFMQAQSHYLSEAQCRASLDMQKKHMRDLIKQAGQEVKSMEGTCIQATVNARSKTEKDV